MEIFYAKQKKTKCNAKTRADAAALHNNVMLIHIKAVESFHVFFLSNIMQQ